jgi:hypothetical protein
VKFSSTNCKFDAVLGNTRLFCILHPTWGVPGNTNYINLLIGMAALHREIAVAGLAPGGREVQRKMLG